MLSVLASEQWPAASARENVRLYQYTYLNIYTYKQTFSLIDDKRLYTSNALKSPLSINAAHALSQSPRWFPAVWEEYYASHMTLLICTQCTFAMQTEHHWRHLVFAFSIGREIYCPLMSVRHEPWVCFGTEACTWLWGRTRSASVGG